MNKRKILVAAMALCVAAILVVGGTLAYFTDTDSAKNTFTAGTVAIDLTEVKVDANDNGDLVPVDDEGNIVEKIEDGARQDVLDNEAEEYEYGKVYPGQYIVKDPTIENLGSEDVYMAAKVTIKSAGDLRKVLPSGVPGSNYINIATKVALERNGDMVQVVAGGLADKECTWTTYHDVGGYVYAGKDEPFHGFQVVKSVEGGSDYFVLYFFIDNPKATGESVTLFEQLNFAWNWDNEDMAIFETLDIDVEAYAVQAYGFTDDDCYVAITTAFPEAFADVIVTE